MATFLTALGAGLAVLLELLEATAIVLAVGVSRRWKDALIGAAAGILACAALAALLGPVLLSGLTGGLLRSVIGTLLLLFGLEWLRKGILRLAGRRSLSNSFQEYIEEREALEALEAPAPGEPDWPARVVAGKGVLLEGVEVVLIVAALGAGPDGLTPAVAGAALAVVVVVGVGFALHRPLMRLPESHLKYAVGVVLSSFGVFFLGEGLGTDWPGGDVALLYVAATLLAVSQAAVATLAREPVTA